MVRSALSLRSTVMSLLMVGMLASSGCRSKTKYTVLDGSQNAAALERTADVQSMTAGSSTEKQALQLFNDFYAEYSVEAIREGVRKLYADDAWFGDPFHVVEGIDDIEHYFLVMAEPVEHCTFTVDSMQRSGNDYYARWTMVLESKAAKGAPIKTLGISHVRFNPEGKIVFQQDYWDTSAMLDRLPVVGFWTRLVKNRIEKGLEK